MKNQENVRVVICPPCGENVAVATKEGQNWKKSLWPLLPHLSAVLPPQGREMPYGFTARSVIPQCRYAGYNGRTGFTLIELLVVVLIIGILAAVAVPQYQVAVAKSRVSTILPIGKAIVQAQYVYYMSTGNYSNNAIPLDVSLEGVCQNFYDSEGNDEDFQDSEIGKFWTCGKDFMLDVSSLGVWANYCPGHNNSTPQSCRDVRDFNIEFYYPQYPTDTTSNYTSKSGQIRCSVKNNSSFGKKICNSLSL